MPAPPSPSDLTSSAPGPAASRWWIRAQEGPAAGRPDGPAGTAPPHSNSWSPDIRSSLDPSAAAPAFPHRKEVPRRQESPSPPWSHGAPDEYRPGGFESARTAPTAFLPLLPVSRH